MLGVPTIVLGVCSNNQDVCVVTLLVVRQESCSKHVFVFSIVEKDSHASAQCNINMRNISQSYMYFYLKIIKHVGPSDNELEFLKQMIKTSNPNFYTWRKSYLNIASCF